MAIQFRRGAPPENYILKNGEPGWDTVNKILKVGDGVTPWGTLPSVSNIPTSELANVIENYLETHPITGVTETDLIAAINSHIESSTPHPVYDADMPSLKLIFENGLV